MCFHQILLQQAGIDGHAILLIQRPQVQREVIAECGNAIWIVLGDKLYSDRDFLPVNYRRVHTVNVTVPCYAFNPRFLVAGAVLAIVVQSKGPLSRLLLVIRIREG